MNIGRVSSTGFGKIIRVKAPDYIAAEVARIANGNGRKKVDKEIKEIFNDTNEGNAVNWSLNGISYVLSGPEASKFEQYNGIMFSQIDYAYSYYNGGHLAKIQSDEAVRSFNEKIADMIGAPESRQALNVEYDKKTSRIKSVNLIG